MGQTEPPEASTETSTCQLIKDCVSIEESAKLKIGEGGTTSKCVSEVTTDEHPICRICHCTSEDVDLGCKVQANSDALKKTITKYNGSVIDLNDPFFLITPCFCTGTLQYVHHKCLEQWIRSSNHKYCELCKYNFKLKTKNKPLYKVKS